MKIVYWLSTSAIASFLLLSAYTYIFSKDTIDGIRDLGFPDFFRMELAVLKLIAVFVLLIPAIPLPVKEWGYAGVALFLLTAFVAHIAHKDSWMIMVLLVILFAILITSYYSMHKIGVGNI